MSLLTIQDVADELTVSKGTVYNLVHAGKIGYIKVQGQFRFKPEHLQHYKDQNECPPANAKTVDTKSRVLSAERDFIGFFRKGRKGRKQTNSKESSDVRFLMPRS